FAKEDWTKHNCQFVHRHPYHCISLFSYLAKSFVRIPHLTTYAYKCSAISLMRWKFEVGASSIWTSSRAMAPAILRFPCDSTISFSKTVYLPVSGAVNRDTEK